MDKILLLGPVTKDIIIKPNFKDNTDSKINISYNVGGAVYFQSLIFNSLNIDYLAGISLANLDNYLIEDFPNKDLLNIFYKEKTLSFINEYYTDNPDNRKQYSNFANSQITIDNLKEIFSKDSNFSGIIINPLIATNFSLDIFKFIKSLDLSIILSLQGLLRFKSTKLTNESESSSLENQFNQIDLKSSENLAIDFNDQFHEIELKSSEKLFKILNFVDFLFLDENEAKILSECIFENDLNFDKSMDEIATNSFLTKFSKKLAKFGPKEIIITQGSRGSFIFNKNLNKTFKINPVVPDKIINPTGCGDSYLSAYVSKRLNDYDCEDSGNFASKIASKKLSSEF